MQDPRELVAAFDALIRPLELRTGQRLNEPSRSEAFRAYLAAPAGFSHCATAALERERDGQGRPFRNRNGLLMRMLADSDHLAAERASDDADASSWRLWALVDVDGRDEVVIEHHVDESECRARATELRLERQVVELELTAPDGRPVPNQSGYVRA